MTNDGIFRILNMRIEELRDRIHYLQAGGLHPDEKRAAMGHTPNEWNNGVIHQCEKEIEFLNNLLKHVRP